MTLNARMREIELSIIVPVFNEADVLPELQRRLLATLETLNAPFEIIYVNDGSADGTLSLLEEIASGDLRVKVIALSRNFGHQPALTAGCDHASGRALILMDGDLQDRPEAIPDFIRAWKEGSEVVYAVRASRQETWPLRKAFSLFYWLMKKMSGIDQPLDAGIFSLLDRKVIDVLRSMPERNRYFPGLRAYAGFNQTGIPVDRDARYAGASRVRVSGMIKLALDGLFSFSYLPIRIITATGCITAVGSVGYAFRVLYKKLVSGEAILGWASTLSAILFLGSLQLIMLGILGEYLGRIYEEVKNRPYYVVARKINLT